MIVNNVYTERSKLKLDTSIGILDIFKYSYYSYINTDQAKACNLYGDYSATKKGVLPIWYLLQKRLTDSLGEICLSGTLQVSNNGANRQDFLSELKQGGSLENNILYLKHEFDNPYDQLAISIRTLDNNGAELDLGFIPRFRPNKKNSTFADDSGQTSNLQKQIAIDQEQGAKERRIIITNYKVIGGYDGKHYGLLIKLGKKLPMPLDLTIDLPSTEPTIQEFNSNE